MLAGLSIASASNRRQQFDFRFGQGGFRDDEIFDSATSPPSRYIIELGRRLLEAEPTADAFVIGNPLLPLRARQLAAWQQGGGPEIGTDAAGFPLYYVLPRAVFAERERFLLPLSTVDAAADARLLGFLCGGEVVQRQCADFTIGRLPATGKTYWLNEENKHDALRLHCARAIALMERRDDWASVPTANFHPNHAGDILFFSIASHDVERPLYQKHIICASYMDIWEACKSRLEPVRLKLAWLPRDYTVSEARYFAIGLERLGEEFLNENFVVFTRFLRHYTYTPFHFMDHARFSLGDPIRSMDRTVHGRPPAVEGRCTLPPRPLRVLLHAVGGGWTLKSFPPGHTRRLCRLLVSLGCEVSVVDGPDLSAEGGRVIACDDTETLTAAIRRHHIVVGVDSYPQHFARHVLGWPTILLLGNTKSDNPGLPWAPAYRSLLSGLPCDPCGSRGDCPLTHKRECMNYPSPERVAGVIAEMARTLYGAAL